MNHHQKPVADCLYKMCGDDYHYITTMPFPETFIKVGYSNYDNTGYIIPYYEEKNKELINKLVVDADVVIMGGAFVEELINIRINTGNLLLFYSERWHNRLRSYILVPFRYISGYIYRRFMRFNKKNVYMLCASAFVPNDCRWENSFKNKTYKWGYFAPFEDIDINRLLNERRTNKSVKILYVARCLRWKHPELAIKAVLFLKSKGYNVHLTMVGGVFDLDSYSKKVFDRCKQAEKEHPDTISVLGAIENHKVRDLMYKSDIFYFTSDRNEGWGAVLNEAMSSGLACIVSDAIGSSRYLIKDGKNGLLFKSRSSASLIEKTKILLDNEDYMRTISLEAYKTIRDQWQPAKAAERLMTLCCNLIEGNETTYSDGPCSKAYPIKNKIL